MLERQAALIALLAHQEGVDAQTGGEIGQGHLPLGQALFGVEDVVAPEAPPLPPERSDAVAYMVHCVRANRPVEIEPELGAVERVLASLRGGAR